MATPRYAHLPVAVDGNGEKLSKQTFAPAVDAAQPLPALVAALEFLGQRPPADLARTSVQMLWQWALENWRLAKVPRAAVLSAR